MVCPKLLLTLLAQFIDIDIDTNGNETGIFILDIGHILHTAVEYFLSHPHVVTKQLSIIVWNCF